MFSSKTTQIFFKNIFSSHFITHRILFFQSSNFTLRNFKPNLFQLMPYVNFSPSYHTSSEKSTSPSILSKIIKYNPKQFPSTFFSNLIVTGIILSIPVDLLYTWYQNRCNEYLLNETMEKGTRPQIDIFTEEFVPRPDIVNSLKKIFKPNKYHSCYYMICGEHGTGKTTLTKIASKEVGQGVIYINIPKKFNTLENFGVAFEEAINFTFKEHVAFSKKILSNINDNKIYKEKYGKPPIIIYDNISQLIPKYSDIIDYLQDNAKDNADDGNFISVFVCNENSVPRRMEMRSAWSRAKKPVIEIGDLSEKESMKYLINKRKIKKEEAKKLYELVGGRIVELKEVADDFISGQSFEVIKDSKLIKVEKRFKAAKLLQDQSNYEIGKRLIKVLLDSKEINTDVFREYFKDDKYNEILEANVFTYHPSRDTVTFQSKLTECYIRKNANIFIS
ncbi:hypothetical protein Glove_327g19 [Diversispora epigaea]|uniref:ATPase AAA-type core domain-containing protein n=1 Tax=Diversispora epigaea TaxID=1348612 RepID=A0A397HRT0_9GLOM|nr:hypothetical protein Glove_327g19 [Diversispora epigaea]